MFLFIHICINYILDETRKLHMIFFFCTQTLIKIQRSSPLLCMLNLYLLPETIYYNLTPTWLYTQFFDCYNYQVPRRKPVVSYQTSSHALSPVRDALRQIYIFTFFPKLSKGLKQCFVNLKIEK